MNDPFSGRAASPIGPARRLHPVTPADGQDLPNGLCRSLFVGQAGTLTIVDSVGTTVTIASLDGQYHPVCARRVLSTGTTAGGILALY